MLKRYEAALAGLLVGAALPALAADCPTKAPGALVTAGALTFGTILGTPPQVYADNGEPAGFDVDVARAVAARLCLKASFVNMAYPGLLPGLSAHKFDVVVAGIGITPQREKVFDFVPYFQGGIRLVVLKAAKLDFKDEEALCGHSVATVTGSVEARALERANAESCAADRKIVVKIYPNFSEAVQQLRKTVVDVAFVDWPFAAYVTNLMPELAVGSPILSGTPGRPRNREGIVLRKDDAAGKDAVGQAFAAVQADGDYDRLLAKWHLEEGDIRAMAAVR